VAEVAPGMELKVAPESVETSHCTVGVGDPVAAELKLAISVAVTMTLEGLVVTEGGLDVSVTVKSAAVVVALPAALENTASYWLPFSAVVLEKLNVVEVAPGMELKVTPALVETFHCTVGVGDPVAAAMKVAVSPMGAEVLEGF
jgi:hypothetical protein